MRNSNGKVSSKSQPPATGSATKRSPPVTPRQRENPRLLKAKSPPRGDHGGAGRISTESLLTLKPEGGAFKESFLYKKTMKDAGLAPTGYTPIPQDARRGKSLSTNNGLKHYESLIKQYNRLLRPVKMVDLLKPKSHHQRSDNAHSIIFPDHVPR